MSEPQPQDKRAARPRPVWGLVIFGLIFGPMFPLVLGVFLYTGTMVIAVDTLLTDGIEGITYTNSTGPVLAALAFLGLFFGLLFGASGGYFTIAPIFLIGWGLWHLFTPRHRWHFAIFTAFIGASFAHSLATELTYPIIPETTFTAITMAIGGALIGFPTGLLITATYARLPCPPPPQ
ncbi:hypothetical protein NHF45_00330 [Maricaulaceae bacterium NA33B04]|nr:hypothetical protein [Maricaulaceae bacterium NA33B04]